MIIKFDVDNIDIACYIVKTMVSYRLLKVFPMRRVYVYIGMFSSYDEAMRWADKNRVGVFAVQENFSMGTVALYETDKDSDTEEVYDRKTNTWVMLNCAQVGTRTLTHMTELKDSHETSYYGDSGDSENETISEDELLTQNSDDDKRSE